ncbi:nitroreductase [Candidatus Methylacidiphilum fumarolicum]|uniref:Nitroreductase n=2 Tax=Candidatus Methylacidiphilum fumarolicum TaxID=591154 RepID=I0JVG1_METFB|nr:nitroreductase family protein [Candidatus Methylacidiphilum fumarolicum]MBW6414866.1 nitroreductase family protein [Candidatus Methylacidiphilum fumarolicum]TFE68306.1 nitroreductase [Candidatus Methylacidiphilum fumarolicum]TFE73532.1 nitroreductase [Candidatus Methylacidiphilum fumarolicum]TFE75007.1 nitroreductase [Candidatus Methylacidiphilum fumarolicum]TFE76551.1 nitroreductase [Candidatus Methylacidiphilum fumarolicum]
MGIRLEERYLAVFDYHERTKHRLQAYAPSPMFLDWENEPFLFRVYEGACKVFLPILKDIPSPSFDSLGFKSIDPHPISIESISLFLLDSLAISAWKSAPGLMPWSLRINPSSGNLHPTEVYLLLDAIGNEETETALYHYCALYHCLEKRAILGKNLLREWGLTNQFFLVGISSIFWRESWKYGERAYRYCQLDIGHVLGTISYAAAMLGWNTYIIEGVGTELLGSILGIASQRGMEKEHPETLLLISPPQKEKPKLFITEEKFDKLIPKTLFGVPNRLSKEHFPWPVIEKISEACQQASSFPIAIPLDKDLSQTDSQSFPSFDRKVAAREIIRRRRSAQAMDNKAWLDKDHFLLFLQKIKSTLSNRKFPFDLFRENFIVALLFFVNRIEGLPQGLYLLNISSDLERVTQMLDQDFLWENIFAPLPFFFLKPFRSGMIVQTIHCHQSIASNGFFSLGIMVEFEKSLQLVGPAVYPKLFWQCGLLGQLLYLEAEASGFRGTGIGCFFDDECHRLLGINDKQWQSLYHFTIGKEIVDKRIQKIDPYFFLEKIRKELVNIRS